MQTKGLTSEVARLCSRVTLGTLEMTHREMWHAHASLFYLFKGKRVIKNKKDKGIIRENVKWGREFVHLFIIFLLVKSTSNFCYQTSQLILTTVSKHDMIMLFDEIERSFAVEQRNTHKQHSRGEEGERGNYHIERDVQFAFGAFFR